MGFSRQEYWSGLAFPSPGDLPDSGVEATTFMSPALETCATWEAPYGISINIIVCTICSKLLWYSSSILIFCLAVNKVFLFGIMWNISNGLLN